MLIPWLNWPILFNQTAASFIKGRRFAVKLQYEKAGKQPAFSMKFRPRGTGGRSPPPGTIKNRKRWLNVFDKRQIYICSKWNGKDTGILSNDVSGWLFPNGDFVGSTPQDLCGLPQENRYSRSEYHNGGQTEMRIDNTERGKKKKKQ